MVSMHEEALTVLTQQAVDNSGKKQTPVLLASFPSVSLPDV